MLSNKIHLIKNKTKVVLVLYQDLAWCPQVSQMPALIMAMNCLDNGESVENKVNFRNNFLLSPGWWQAMHMKTHRCQAIAQHLDCCLQELIFTTRSFIIFFFISSMYKSGSQEEKMFPHISDGELWWLPNNDRQPLSFGLCWFPPMNSCHAIRTKVNRTSRMLISNCKASSDLGAEDSRIYCCAR